MAIYRMECEGWSNDDAVREMMTMGTPRTVFPEDVTDFLLKYQPSRK